MANADDERALQTQQKKDLSELYPTQEAWERGYPLLKPPDDPLLRQQYDDYLQLYPPDSRVNQALKQGEASTGIAAEGREKSQRHLHMHEQMMRGAAEASRDVLHDNGPGKEPGAYTTYEARDRAAHTPPAHTLQPDK